MSTRDHRAEPAGTAGPVARRRVAAVLALLVAAAVAVGVVLSTRSSPGKTARGVPVTGTTTVQRRDLVETDTEPGTISYASPEAVYNRLSGTVTWLPSAGQLIRPGQPLYEVDAQPVILMNGTTPAYRELTSSDTDGQDIRQLNRNLVNLGFNPGRIIIDDAWQAATTIGVEALQASLGQAVTGSLSLGQVVFLSGDQVVSAMDTGLGSVGGGAGDPSSSAGSAASAMPILQTTSTQLIVTVDLPASSQGEAKAGETVTVEMPTGNTVNAVITAVSPVAASGSSSSSGSSGSSSAAGSSSGAQATVPVTIMLKGHVSGAGLDQSPVSVNFAQAVADNVLSVPVTALLATPGGGYVVQEALAPRQLIPVTTGLFAAGYVHISGPGIYPGLQVTNSQG